MAERLVRFDIYCQKCKHYEVERDEDGVMGEPCNECLNEPVNEDSKKPVKFEEDKR